jgi:hypothetical protein
VRSLSAAVRKGESDVKITDIVVWVILVVSVIYVLVKTVEFLDIVVRAVRKRWGRKVE